MAKFIKDIHDFIGFLTGKGQTGYHSPEEIDNAVHVASRNLYNEKVKDFEKTRQITTSIIPFCSDPETLSLDSNGRCDYPDGFKYTSSFSGGPNKRPIEEVDKAMLANKINDPICPPTSDYGIVTYFKNFLQFYPINITNVETTFLSEPVKPKWAYTIVSNRPVYDDTNSIDIEWGEQDHNSIIFMTLEHLGVNLREQNLVEFSQIKKRDN